MPAFSNLTHLKPFDTPTKVKNSNVMSSLENLACSSSSSDYCNSSCSPNLENRPLADDKFNVEYNKNKPFLSNFLALDYFQLSGTILDNVKFKRDAVAPHFTCNSMNSLAIKNIVFKTFVHLSTNSKSKWKCSVERSTVKKRVEAVRAAFDAVFKEFTIENFHRFFKNKIRYGYIHSDLNIELFNSQDIITSDYEALLLFNEDRQFYVIGKQIGNFIKFGKKSANFCNSCGQIFISALHHSKYCSVKGSKLSLGSKLGEESAELTSKIKNIMESLGITEDFESTEPTLYLRRSCDFQSTSVLKIKDREQTLRSLFNVYYYSSLQSTKDKNVSNLLKVSKSKLCQQSFRRFMLRYKEVTISNLESYFSNLKAKFYFKCNGSNKLNPCKFEIKNEDKHKRIFFIYIIGHFFVVPRGHLKKWLKISGFTSGWCSLCSNYFKNCYNHTKICSQTRICTKCLGNCGMSSLSTYVAKCALCQISFRSENCFKIYICLNCGQYVNKFVCKTKHNCTSTKCGTCQVTIEKTDFKHQCKIYKLKENTKTKSAVFVFYDIECYCNKENYEQFVECLLVAHTACNECTLSKNDKDRKDVNPSNFSESNKCMFCGSLKVEFWGTGCAQLFVDFLLKLEVEYGDAVKTIYAIALNAGRFDSWFIYKHILSNSHLLVLPPLLLANKILMLPFSAKIKCIDALNYVPLALSKYGPSFELNVKKTSFPHDWLTREIFLQNYVKFPLFSDFPKDSLSYSEYQALKNEYCDSKGIFPVHKMLSDYCHMDCAVLRLGFMKYIRIIHDRFNIHPLENTVTLSSVTWKLFKTHFISDELYTMDSFDELANNSKNAIRNFVLH